MSRVLVVEPAGNLWGSERALLDLIDSLDAWEIAVCCPPATPIVAELERRGVRVFPFLVTRLHEKSRFRRLQAAAGILRACIAFRPDVIHLNQSGVYKVTAPAARLMGKPVVAHVRLFEDVAYLAGQTVRGPLAAIIAISDSVAIEITKFQSLSDVPVERIYDAFGDQSDATQDSDRDPANIACVGRIVPMKGQDILLKSLPLLRKEGLTCFIVGSGPHDFMQELRTIELGEAQSSVRWCGFTEDVYPVLRTCSILVCPSWREPLGRVILEAWTAGAIPVVFGGSGGAAEIVNAANGGIVYAEQTAQSLAAALRAAVDLTPGERARLVANGRAWLEANCARRAYGRKMAAVFEQVAQK